MENLDNFIKEKLAQDSIEFSEAHWMKAAKMIEEQEMTKRKRFVIWSFFAQVLMTMLVVVFFVNFKINIDTTAPPVSPQTNLNQERLNTATILNKNTTVPSVLLQTNLNQEPLTTATIPNKNTSIPSVSPQANLSQEPLNTATIPNVVSNRDERLPISTEASVTGVSSEGNEPLDLTYRPQLKEAVLLQSKASYLEYDFVEDFNKAPQLLGNKQPFYTALSLYAGSSLYPYTQIGAKRLIAYTAGVNYSINLKKSWSLEAAAHYRVREGDFGASQTTTQDSFAFRRISTEHSLTATALHTIEIPLAISYTKYRHQLQFGVNYVRLLGVKGSLNKKDNQDDLSIKVLEKGWLDDDGFNQNRFELMLGYYYTLKPGFRVGANVHYILGGIVENGASPDLLLESKPLFIDFGIRYDLLKR